MLLIEPLSVTVLPAAFLGWIYESEAVSRIRRTYSKGDPPVGKVLFACCKYAIAIPWGGMILRSWNPPIPPPGGLSVLKWFALALWMIGFALLFAGRLSMGPAFRPDLPREKTRLAVRGVFRFSRNPMYLGIDTTLAAAAIYTMNPFVLAFGIFIAAVHHKIVRAEELKLRSVFGGEYEDYCRRVHRYL